MKIKLDFFIECCIMYLWIEAIPQQPFFNKEYIMTEKTVNYTDALTKTIIAAYNKEPTLANAKKIAVENNRTLKSIIAKLVSEGVYKKKERVTKNGSPVITKMELVKKINAHFNIEINSLVKSTKVDLQKLVTSFS